MVCRGSAWPKVHRNGVVARTAQIWRIAPLPHRPGPQPTKTDRANYPSAVVEYPVSEPISFRPDHRPRSSTGSGWKIVGAPAGQIRQVARRCSERVRGFSRRFTPWCDRQGGTTAQSFQENEEVSRAAPDTVGQLLG